MSVQSFRLFHTCEDTSSEYKLQKIKYDDAEFEKLISTCAYNVDEKLSCAGFMSDRTQICIACEYFLELTSEQVQCLKSLLEEQTSLIPECLITCRKV